VPPNKDEKEPWTWKIEGGVFPGWTRRLARGKKDFWRADEHNSGVDTANGRTSESSSGAPPTLEKPVYAGEKGSEKEP
jgi:AGZA family xanthine/uracil permease-like MFS transporter